LSGISLSTTKTHLASLMNKLGARNRVELAMWAYQTDRVKSDLSHAQPRIGDPERARRADSGRDARLRAFAASA
jgi:hypothetical protein